MGVSGPSPYPWGPARTPYPLKPLPLNGAAQLMQRGCAKLGIRTSPAANAALSGSYATDGTDFRPACHNCGFCQAGCATGAKGSADVTWLPLAVRGPAPRSAPNATSRASSAIVPGASPRSCTARRGARRASAAAPCSSARARSRRRACCCINGLANGSGEVGRNFMAHTGIQVWGQFDDVRAALQGHPGRAHLRGHAPARRRRFRGAATCSRASASCRSPTHRRSRGAGGCGGRRCGPICAATTTRPASTSWATACPITTIMSSCRTNSTPAGCRSRACTSPWGRTSGA